MAFSWTDFWNNILGVTPKTDGFVPTFEPQQYVYVPNNVGGLDTYPIKIYYFATQSTAEWLNNKYNPKGIVVFVPYGGSGGPNTATALERHLRFPNGKRVNAGILAQYYVNNPEDKAPGVAESLIRDVLTRDGAF